MTLAYQDRPRTKAPERAPAPAPRLRPPQPSVYVPPLTEKRPRRRIGAGVLTVLTALSLLALQPWKHIPSDREALREAFLNVGVPRQYRELMAGTRPVRTLAPAPLMGLEDAPPELEPAALAVQDMPAPAAPPPQEVAPAPVVALAAEPPARPVSVPAPKPALYAVRTAPPAPAAPAVEAAPPKVEASVSYRVQIAATATDAEAEDAWRKVRRAFPEETRERSLAITPAQVNGRAVRRAIVTGFPTREAAQAFCARLAAADRGCLLRGKG